MAPKELQPDNSQVEPRPSPQQARAQKLRDLLQRKPQEKFQKPAMPERIRKGKVVDEREAPAHIQKAREIRRRMDRQAMEKLAQASGGEDGDAIRMVSAAPRPMSKAELIYQERQERQRRRREAAARGTSEQLGTARKATYGEPDDVGLNPEDQEKLLEVFKNMSGFVEQTRASLETMDATDQEVGDLDARLVDSLQKLQQVVSNETCTQSD